jgi:hypothetical protein
MHQSSDAPLNVLRDVGLLAGAVIAGRFLGRWAIGSSRSATAPS